MHLSTKITENIMVNYYPQPKKKRNDPTSQYVFIHFTITENGIKQSSVALSTGKSVRSAEWGQKEMKGNSERAKKFNTALLTSISNVQLALEKLRIQDSITCSQVKDFIVENIKPTISGKTPKGKKEEILKKMNQNSFEAVLKDLFEFGNQSQERRRIYRHALSIFYRFCEQKKGCIPLITNISERDLITFQTWYRKNVRCTHGERKGLIPSQDSTTTWFTMIAAVFNHALTRMKILQKSPLPKKFRGSFSDTIKPVLSEDDCLKLFELPDDCLSHEKQIAKYCLGLQLTTSMGLGDIKALTSDHVKWDESLEVWYISKIREKHKHLENPKPFTVILSAKAKLFYDKLFELSGGAVTCFTLTSIDNINAHYKDLARLAGVKQHVTTYTLRHTFAVNFMDNEGNLEDLGEIMGNDVRNTKKYGRISRQRLANRTKLLEQKSKLHQV